MPPGTSDSRAQSSRLPLVVGPENRDSAAVKDARLINGFVEGEWVYKRPGLQLYSPVGGGTGMGMYNWKGDLYSINGGQVYKGLIPIGGAGVDTSNGKYHFSEILGTPNRLFMMNGVKAYTWDNTTFTQVTDPDYPSDLVKGTAYLDGTLYVMEPNATIHGSDLDNPLSWSALNTIRAQVEPDNGIALAKQLIYVVALKQWSTEFFYDAAVPTGSPLLPIQAGKIPWGCANADSVRDMDTALIWLAANRSAGLQVVVLEQLKPRVVSTKPIERILNAIPVTAAGVDPGNTAQPSVMSWVHKREGHYFYGLSFPTHSLTLVYDMTEDRWAQWTGFGSANAVFNIVDSAPFSAGSMMQSLSNGYIYACDQAYFVDDLGASILFDLYTPNFDGGTRVRKHLKRMEVVADQGGGRLALRVSEDDYQSWSNYRYFDLGQKRPFLLDCGTFSRRAFHFHHDQPRPLRLKGVDLYLGLGTL